MKFRSKYRLILALLIAPVTGSPAATWYLDSDVTGTSSNAGTSWANAYTNVASIVWASVAPGDLISLSDGTYGGYITPTVSGTEANPILIKASQEPGHNGRIDITSGFKPNGVAWITLDGAKDDSYTNQITSTFDVPNITNNINIHMAQFAYTSGSGPLGLRVKWVEMSFPEPTSPGQQCVLFSAASGGDATNVSISYSAIHTSGDFGIYASGDNTVVGWDDFTIDHCYIHNTGDDPVQWGSGGLTMHHNYVGETARTQGHGDCLQAHSDHIRFYNNIVRDQHNSGLRIEALQSETVWTHGVHVYGNLWYCRDFDSVGAEHVAFLTYGNFVGPQVYTNSYWTNVVFANNTWARIPDPGTPLAISKRTNYLTVTIRGFKIQNNLIWTTAPRSASEQGVAIGGTTGWDYSIGTDLIFDHNVVSGVATNVGTGITSTSSAEPTFADADADDYTLAAADTVARNQGTDLSALDLPGWETDMMGNTRGADGYVDLGAFEYTGDLLVRIDFEDVFTDSTLSDTSGNGNHGHRFGRPGSVAPTNFPIRVSASATGGTNSSTYAGDFYWNTNSDYGFYLKDGNYAALTNVPAFTNRSQMTIAVRARYSPASRIDASYDSSTDGNATLISAGSASADIGSWDLQRFNESVSLNNTRFMVVTNSNFGIPQVGSSGAAVFGKSGRAVFNFPDRGYDNDGDTTNWHHYAMTFNAGIVVTYFDGEPIVTNDLSGTTTTLTVGMNVSVNSASGFIGIGANTHGGTPALENETGEDYPNHGWFNGQMDDVIVYSRALTWPEVVTLSGYPVDTGGSGGGLGEESSFTRSKRTGKQVGRGKVVWR